MTFKLEKMNNQVKSSSLLWSKNAIKLLKNSQILLQNDTTTNLFKFSSFIDFIVLKLFKIN